MDTTYTTQYTTTTINQTGYTHPQNMLVVHHTQDANQKKAYIFYSNWGIWAILLKLILSKPVQYGFISYTAHQVQSKR